MVHNRHITASELMLERQTASDDNTRNEGGIYDTGATGQRHTVECLRSIPGEKPRFTFTHLKITENKVRFV